MCPQETRLKKRKCSLCRKEFEPEDVESLRLVRDEENDRTYHRACLLVQFNRMSLRVMPYKELTLEELRLRLKSLVIQTQKEMVSYRGVETSLRDRLIGAWAELWLRAPERELDVEWVMNAQTQRKETSDADVKRA